MNPHAQLAIGALERASPLEDLQRATRAFAGYSPEKMNSPFGDSEQTPNEILAGYAESVDKHAAAIAWLRSVTGAPSPKMRQTLAGVVPVSVDSIDKLDAVLGRWKDRYERAEETIRKQSDEINAFSVKGEFRKVERYKNGRLHLTFIVDGDLPLLTEYDFSTVKLTPKSLRDDYDEF